MSATAYDCILSCCPDESSEKCFSGIEAGDGESLLARLQNVCGNKQQRIEQLDEDIKNCSVTTISKWPAYRDNMVTLLGRRNNVPGIDANKKESDAKQLRQFMSPLAPLFGTPHDNYIFIDGMLSSPTMTVVSTSRASPGSTFGGGKVLTMSPFGGEAPRCRPLDAPRWGGRLRWMA
jgi:hypothetical protein